MAIYTVSDRASGKTRLVDAKVNSAALRHVAHDVFSVAIAKPREIAHLVANGTLLEVAGDAGEPELPIKSEDISDAT